MNFNCRARRSLKAIARRVVAMVTFTLPWARRQSAGIYDIAAIYRSAPAERHGRRAEVIGHGAAAMLIALAIGNAPADIRALKLEPAASSRPGRLLNQSEAKKRSASASAALMRRRCHRRLRGGAADFTAPGGVVPVFTHRARFRHSP